MGRRTQGIGGTVALGLAVLLVGAACGDDGGEDAADDASGTTAPPSTTTTHPPASGDTEDEAFAIVEDLWQEYHDVTDMIAQDPSRVQDPESAAVEQYLGVFTADSPIPDQFLDSMAERAAAGERFQPAGEVFKESMLYRPRAIDEDTIEFGYCTAQDAVRVDGDGNVLGDASSVVAVGSGEAHREDGVWRLHDFLVDPDGRTEGESGQLPSRACDQVIGDSRGEDVE